MIVVATILFLIFNGRLVFSQSFDESLSTQFFVEPSYTSETISLKDFLTIEYDHNGYVTKRILQVGKQNISQNPLAFSSNNYQVQDSAVSNGSQSPQRTPWPVIIPNTEVKPSEVDGTLVARLWESR